MNILERETGALPRMKSPGRRGFSLVELLAVMTIIAVLLSLASVGVGKMGKGQGITGGVALGEGMLAQARSLAINQNTRARLIIHSELNDADPEERQRYRRMMMVVYREMDDQGREQDRWIRSGSPVFLPEGVYFSPEISKADMRTGAGQLPFETFQLSNDPSDVRKCYYYEFNGQGVNTMSGAAFVLEAGARPMNQEKPILGGKKTVGGFVVLRNGSTAQIRDINQLGAIDTR